MRQAVLADCGPLYAAVDPHDALHQRALTELGHLAQQKYRVLVSFPTVLEAYNLVLFRLGGTVARRWIGEITESVLVNPTPEDYRQGISRLRQYADQSITFFDATLAVLAMRMEIPVWTYDHHFDVMRIPVWR